MKHNHLTSLALFIIGAILFAFPSCDDDVVTIEAVDLGLPSGTKWASCNIGASSPHRLGSRFAWGETSPKKEYNYGNYKYKSANNSSYNKYVGDVNEYHGQVIITTIGDNKRYLEPEDDAATVNWGKKWHTPSLGEFEELSDYCTWEETTQSGIKGWRIKSNMNGNSIFLPIGDGDGYWTSHIAGYDFNAVNVVDGPVPTPKPGLSAFRISGYRYSGRFVRPVTRD